MDRTKFILILVGVLAVGLVFVQPTLAVNDTTEEVIPFGITNPFKFEDYDFDYLDKNKGPLDQNETRQYMKDLADIGINVISQHFHRKKYDNDGSPHFKMQKQQIKTYLVEPQTYLKGGKNPFYFWAAISTDTNKCFAGDIIVEVKNDFDKGLLRQIIANGAQLKKVKTCVPYSAAGFGEFNNWLSLAIDLFSDPEVVGAGQNLTDRLAYIQIGNEPDGDYKKPKSSICPDPVNPDCYYHRAYAQLIEKVYDTIKEKAPKAKIVIGTLAGGAVSMDGFHKPTLEYLFNGGDKKCNRTGCFDLFDYHAFGEFTAYNTRVITEKGVTLNKDFDYFRGILNEIGFSDKGLVIQQAATHTGSEPKEELWGSEYQTEKDQASFLVKRMVYNVSKGMVQSQYGPLIEHYCYKDTIHNHFTLGGLLYNGIPDKDRIPWCQEKNPLPKDYNTATCDGQLPCPDPGKDVKKLSYYSYKRLIETLKGSDLGKIEPINTGVRNTFVYKFIKKDTQEPVYVAWWDWWKDYPRKGNEVEGCKTTYEGNYTAMDECVNNLGKDKMNKNITLSFVNTGKIKVTKALPNYTVGAQVNDYDTAFYSYEVNDKDDGLDDNNFTITLGGGPIYIEEIPDNPPTACVIKPEQIVQSGEVVTLDGGCSSDPENDMLTYQWTQISGMSVDLQNSNMATSSFTAPSIISVKNKNSSLAATLVSSAGAVVEFFKSIFIAGTGADNNNLDFRFAVSANNKTSTTTAKVIVTPPLTSASVTIISPLNGIVLSPDSKIEIKAKAKGENIKSVSFLIDGQEYKQEYKGRYDKREDIYFFDWRVPYGYSKSYNIKAQLTVQLVKKSETFIRSEPVIVSSANTPSVSIINPQNGQIIKPKQKIAVGARLNPNDAGITKVEFLITENGGLTKKQTDTKEDKNSPYSFVWTVPNTPGISYSIQANGYTKDQLDKGQIIASQSEPIVVRVE